ncbi:MAG: glycosyltransferase [Thermoanaerobaculia bacterium]
MNRWIYHIVSSKRYTGGAQVGYLWHKALLKGGIESYFIYEGGYKLEKKIKEEKNTIPYYNFKDKIKKILKIPENSIILAHLSEDHWLSFFLRKKKERVLVFHNNKALKKDFLHKIIYKNTKKAIFAYLLEKNPPFQKYRIFPPVYDLETFKRGRQPNEILNICSIGKMEKERKQEKFLFLCKELKDLNFPFKGYVIGQGNYLDKLKEISKKLGLGEEIHFPGYFEDEKLAEILKEMDFLVWVCPGSQGAHRAVLEAVLCGAVPCSFEMEGIRWWIEDLKTGIILLENLRESAKKIIDTFKNKNYFMDLRENSYKKVIEIVDERKFIKEFMDFLYENSPSSP